MENEGAPPTLNPEQEIPDKNEIIKEKPKKNKKHPPKIGKKKSKKIEETKEEDKKEEKTKEEEEEKDDEKFTEYPKSFFGEFEFDLYDDSLKPDCTYILNDRTYYVYFNLNALYNRLEVKIAELFKKYPKNLENLKDPLQKYMKEYQKEEYKETTSTFGYLWERVKFFFGDEYYNRNVQERLIKMAFLFCQLKSETFRINNLNNKITIGIIDSYNYKIKIYCYEDFKKIKDEVNSIDIKKDNINEINKTLQIIEDKMKTLIDEIKNKYKGSDAVNQPIFILYLLKQIDFQLVKIEESNEVLNHAKTYKKMRNIRSQMNKYIKDNIKREQKKFYFDLDLFFKIIKNTNQEKKVFLDGINIDAFLKEINKNFENLQSHLFKFDKDELQGVTDNPKNKMAIIQFLREKVEKYEKLEKLEENIDKELNDIDSKIYDDLVDGGKSGVSAILSFKDKDFNAGFEHAKKIGKSYFKAKENKIVKAYKEKTKAIIRYNKDETLKLINEYELLDKFREQKRKIKENENINGYIVSKKIRDPKNPILDLYSVDIIY